MYFAKKWLRRLTANIRKWVFSWNKRDGITWRNYKFAWNWCNVVNNSPESIWQGAWRHSTCLQKWLLFKIYCIRKTNLSFSFFCLLKLKLICMFMMLFFYDGGTTSAPLPPPPLTLGILGSKKCQLKIVYHIPGFARSWLFVVILLYKYMWCFRFLSPNCVKVWKWEKVIGCGEAYLSR